jgi:catecholate siderophore receptor
MAGRSRTSPRKHSRNRESRRRTGFLALVTSASIGTAALTPSTAQAAGRGAVRISGESLTKALAERRRAFWSAQPPTAFLVGQRQTPIEEGPILRFAIAAGPLDAVLPQFEAVTGLRVLVDNDAIRQLQSPGASGMFTANQALALLLQGTGVRHRLTNASTVTLDLAPIAEAIEVSVDAQPALSSSKYTQPLRDVPQTVHLIPRALIEEQGATTLRDVLRNVPGITMQAGEGGVPAGDNLTIRGFNARTDIFIDGVRDFGGYSRDSFNLEQVEVIKGPSSASAGRGSTGGSINLVTKRPLLQDENRIAVSGGSADFKRGTIDVNRPIDADAGVAARLNVMWQESGVAGRDVVKNASWGVAPSLAFGVGRPTQVTVSYLHLGQDNVPDYGLPWVPATNVALAEFADQPAPVRSENYYGLRNRDYEEIANDVATVVARHDSTAFSLRNAFRYGRTRRDSLITAPRFADNISTNVRRTDWKSRDQIDGIFSNQSDVTTRFSTARTTHSLVAGVEVSREHDTNFTRIETSPPAPNTDLFNPNPDDAYVSGLARNGARTEGIATTAAVYAFDTVHLNERVEVSGGVRWDSFNIGFTNLDATGPETRFDRSDGLLSWRSGVVYKPAANGSIYAGAGTSLNPSAEGLALTASTADLEPERTRNFEIGTKWDLAAGRASLTFAVFDTEKTNARTPGINPGDPPTVLQGRQRVRGVEFGAVGRLTRWWNVIAGYAGMRSRIVASNTETEVDKALAHTPRHTMNLWTTVEVGPRVQVGGGAQFMDSVFTNAANTRRVPNYWLANATAAWNVSDQLTLRVNAYNLTDRQYIDRVGGGHYIPGPRRSATVTADVGF